MTPQISRPAGVSVATNVTAALEALYFWPLGPASELLSKDYGIIRVLVTLQEIGSA